MEVASFVIACAAFVVGGISLIWQIISWRRSGPVVVVETRQGFPVLGDRVGEQQTHVTAQNRGRSAVTVTGWGFVLPNGDNIVFPNPLPWSTPLPHRLDSHSEATWYVATDVLRDTAAQHDIAYQSLRAFVYLASGDRAKARDRGIGLK